MSNIQTWVLERGQGGKAPQDFEIWHFPITVLEKVVVFLDSSGWK